MAGLGAVDELVTHARWLCKDVGEPRDGGMCEARLTISCGLAGTITCSLGCTHVELGMQIRV